MLLVLQEDAVGVDRVEVVGEEPAERRAGDLVRCRTPGQCNLRVALSGFMQRDVYMEAGVGFEPTGPVGASELATRRLKPLSHPAVSSPWPGGSPALPLSPVRILTGDPCIVGGRGRDRTDDVMLAKQLHYRCATRPSWLSGSNRASPDPQSSVITQTTSPEKFGAARRTRTSTGITPAHSECAASTVPPRPRCLDISRSGRFRRRRRCAGRIFPYGNIFVSVR